MTEFVFWLAAAAASAIVLLPLVRALKGTSTRLALGVSCAVAAVALGVWLGLDINPDSRARVRPRPDLPYAARADERERTAELAGLATRLEALLEESELEDGQAALRYELLGAARLALGEGQAARVAFVRARDLYRAGGREADAVRLSARLAALDAVHSVPSVP